MKDAIYNLMKLTAIWKKSMRQRNMVVHMKNIEMSEKEFNEIFEKIGGKIVTNLGEYIQYKYIPE